VNGSAKLYADLPYSFWADYGSSVTYSFSSTVSSSVADQRFMLIAIHSPPSPFTVTAPLTITGEYCKQYRVTFTHSGLDSTTTGTVVTVNGTAKLYADLPYSLWVNSGSTIMYSFTDPVLSTVSGKRLALVSVTGPSSPSSVTSPVSVIGNYKIQYRVTVDQTGVGNDFAGTVVIVDGTNYNTGGLPVSFWWDKNSNHTFSFGSPLIVNGTSQYAWTSTSGLSSLQSGTLAITASGNVVGNYVLANRITFDHLGIGPDYAGAALIVDGVPYGVSSLPVSFTWGVGTSHSFAFQSPLIVAANTKQYLWTSTTGLSSLQGGTIVVSTFGSIVGNYKTQYYLTLATVPSGAASPSNLP